MLPKIVIFREQFFEVRMTKKNIDNIYSEIQESKKIYQQILIELKKNDTTKEEIVERVESGIFKDILLRVEKTVENMLPKINNTEKKTIQLFLILKNNYKEFKNTKQQQEKEIEKVDSKINNHIENKNIDDDKIKWYKRDYIKIILTSIITGGVFKVIGIFVK